MKMIRFTAKFKDGSEFLLFGEDFFNDKRVFSVMHYLKLIDFREEVCKKDKPIETFDKNIQETLKYSNSRDFNNWQPIPTLKQDSKKHGKMTIKNEKFTRDIQRRNK